jgi:small subunit ribosomal protein S2
MINNPFSLPLSAAVDQELEDMIKAGVHLGHSKSKAHPSMQPYIFGIRNTISLLDLTKTKEKLTEALNFIKEVMARGGLILLVGTRPAAHKVIFGVAEKTKMPYFTERWIGGTLTNFKVILKRVEYMQELELAKVAGEFAKYTKKERMKKEEEISKLNRNFNGLRNLKRLPDALFVVDIIHDDTAVREAMRMKIPIVALADTNSNVDLVDYPIPSNDDALPAVRYMVERVGEAIEEGLKMRQEIKIETKPE